MSTPTSTHFCEECSPTHQLHHTQEWISGVLSEFCALCIPNLSHFPRSERLLEQLVIGGGLSLLRATRLMRRLPVTETSPVHQRIKVITQEAKKRGITVFRLSLLGLTSNMFELTLPNGTTHVFEGLPGMSPTATNIQIDDKNWSKRWLHDLGAPIAEGQLFWRASSAIRYAQHLGFPLVVKPRTGSLSAHTTIDIQTQEELIRAIRVAHQISPTFMVERYVPGSLYRATTVGPHLVAVGRRDPPSIVGDGMRTVRELVTAREAEQHELLMRLGYRPEDVPPLPESHLKRTGTEIVALSERIPITWKINLSFGATVTDVTDHVHPDNRVLFEKIASALEWPCIGIDFLAPDIAISWKEQPCAVIELNSLPSIDLHHPPIIIGETQNVARAVLDELTKTLCRSSKAS